MDLDVVSDRRIYDTAHALSYNGILGW